jgi:hypothetical protein
MRGRLALALAFICCLAALVASRADAQSDRRAAFEVPFDFIVQGRKLPAGRYTVERLNQSNPAILVIKAADGPVRQVFSTQRADAVEMENLTKLVFARYGADHFLFRIRSGGDPNGRQLALSDAARAFGRKGSGRTVIGQMKK